MSSCNMVEGDAISICPAWLDVFKTLVRGFLLVWPVYFIANIALFSAMASELVKELHKLRLLYLSERT